MIHTYYYYHLVNHSQITQKGLTVRIQQGNKKKKISLQKIQDNNLQQIWLLIPSKKPSCYFIANCLSGLVLEINKNKDIQMHHFKHKENQIFRIQLMLTQNSEALISDFSRNEKLYIDQNRFACAEKQKLDVQVKWIFKKAHHNPNIVGSCSIMSTYTGYVMEVNDLAEKQGSFLCQSDWLGLFHQRWIFEKVIEKGKCFYLIKNLKSRKIVTIKGSKIKEGLAIIQSNQITNHKHQLWCIEELGFEIYSIRSAFDIGLFLGTKDHALKSSAELVLVRDQPKHHWKIVGSI